MKNEIALYLLGRRGGWTDQRRLNTAATAVLLAATDGAVQLAGLEGLEEGRYRLDSSLLATLYSAAPRHLKVTLVSSGWLGHLEPRYFKAVFQDAYGLRKLTELQERDLALQLDLFLHRHPTKVVEYVPQVLRFLRSRRQAVRMIGLMLASRLNRIGHGDLALMKGCLSAAEGLKVNALNAFCELVKRHRRLAPEVLAYCTSGDLEATARRLHRHSRSGDVQSSAHYYLTALRRLPGRRSSLQGAGA